MSFLTPWPGKATVTSSSSAGQLRGDDLALPEDPVAHLLAVAVAALAGDGGSRRRHDPGDSGGAPSARAGRRRQTRTHRPTPARP